VAGWGVIGGANPPVEKIEKNSVILGFEVKKNSIFKMLKGWLCAQYYTKY